MDELRHSQRINQAVIILSALDMAHGEKIVTRHNEVREHCYCFIRGYLAKWVDINTVVYDRYVGKRKVLQNLLANRIGHGYYVV